MKLPIIEELHNVIFNELNGTKLFFEGHCDVPIASNWIGTNCCNVVSYIIYKFLLKKKYTVKFIMNKCNKSKIYNYHAYVELYLNDTLYIIDGTFKQFIRDPNIYYPSIFIGSRDELKDILSNYLSSTIFNDLYYKNESTIQKYKYKLDQTLLYYINPDDYFYEY